MKNIPVQKAKELILNLMSIGAIESKINANNWILSDNSWASTGSDYHKQCRKELEEKNARLSETLAFLKES